MLERAFGTLEKISVQPKLLAVCPGRSLNELAPKVPKKPSDTRGLWSQRKNGNRTKFI